jgi:hypothetical protein
MSISRSYFSKIDEESIKSNFVLIYELLDGEQRGSPTILTIRRDPRLWIPAELGD